MCEYELINRREIKIIYKFNIDNTETKEKYYKAGGKSGKLGESDKNLDI